VTRYPMAPHVEDAKDRLIAMGRDVPDPSQAALAESEAEEGSRVNVKLKDKAMLLVRHGPSTVEAARVGEPSVVDVKQTYAPEVSKQTIAAFNAAMRGQPLPVAPAPGEAPVNAAIANGTAPPTTDQPAAKPSFESVPEASGSVGNGASVEITNGNAGSGSSAASPGGAAPANEAAPVNGAAPANNPAAAADPVIKPVGPPENKPLPAIDKPAVAPAQINDVKPGSGQGAQVTTGATSSGKKVKKAPYNSKEESSSKHKKKKGLDKLNPF
jgi:outer membrane protein assembly factor BamD